MHEYRRNKKQRKENYKLRVLTSKGQWTGELFAIRRFRYVEVLFTYFTSTRVKNIVCYTVIKGVPLYMKKKPQYDETSLTNFTSPLALRLEVPLLKNIEPNTIHSMHKALVRPLRKIL